eukprot:ANDGO_07170.mRNA.1 hypothetical protein
MEGSAPLIQFDGVKNPEFTLENGLRTLARRFRNQYRLETNRHDISYDSLSRGLIYVFCNPQSKFTTSEFSAIREYLASGGSVFFCLSDKATEKTNTNYLTEEFGIAANNDQVLRQVPKKSYFYPQEAQISAGVVNREINRAAGFKVSSSTMHANSADRLFASHVAHAETSLSFVYPFGCTLNVQKPAIPLLATSHVCFPLNRPVCAVHAGSTPKSGRLCVLGCARLLSDAYVDREDNIKLLDVLFRYLSRSSEVRLNAIDAEDPEVNDMNYIPDIGALAETVQSCLQESDSINPDFSSLFKDALHRLSTDNVPAVVSAFHRLEVDHKPLGLIPPEFETPLPPLQPAVFPPSMRDLPPPPLDLFDLDEQFASERVRLAQLTNKCTDEDLEYYIRECGEIIGVASELPADQRSAKHILSFVLRQIVNYKRLNSVSETAQPRNNTPEKGSLFGTQGNAEMLSF